jgi:arabinofuranan 3-O-arabinosyltransferase
MANDVDVVMARNRLTGVHGVDPASVVEAVADLPTSDAAVTDPNEPVTAFRGTMFDSGTMAFTLATGGPFRLDRTGRDANYRASVANGRLVLAGADTVAIDGRVLPVRPPLGFALAEPNVVGIDVGGELRVLPARGDVVTIAPNTTLTAYAAQPGNGLSGPFQTAADCGGTPAGAPEANPLRLAVNSGRRCAAAPVQPTAGAIYRVHYSMRNDGGATARVCLWQDGPKECAPLPSPPVAADWTEYTAITRLAPDVQNARLYLYAEGNVGPGIAEFRDVTVTPLRPVGSATHSPGLPAAENITLAAGRHTVTVDRQVSAGTSPSPQFRTCKVAGSDLPSNITDRPIGQPDGSLVLHDPGASACAEAAVIPAVPGATYRLSADYFTHFGGTPRICLHQFPSGRCAETPALVRVAAWRTVNTLVRPMPDTTYIRPELYNYANYLFGAKDMVNGRASFKNFHLTRVSPVSVSVTAADLAPPPVTEVHRTAVSSSEYRVAVHRAAGRFTLTLADSYAPGWALDGLPAGWSARHIAVDGFANGWLVEGTGDATLTIRYRPGQWAFAALATSLLAGLAAAVIAIGQPLLGMARRRGWLGRTWPAHKVGRNSSRRRTPPPRRAAGDS